ncbi:MAG: hypothetical protein ACRELF_05675 [Gemmataceae bacterium]
MQGIWQGLVARFEVTDEEHVRRVRRAVAAYDRWRRRFLAFYVGLAIAYVGLLVAVAVLLQKLKQLGNPQGLAPGFLVGLALGAMTAGLAAKIVHGLLAALMPLRTERLLLQCYDALAGWLSAGEPATMRAAQLRGESTMNLMNALDELLANFGEEQLREVLDFAQFVNARLEREEWRHFGTSQLARCYGPHEPEYTAADLKPEFNP